MDSMADIALIVENTSDDVILKIILKLIGPGVLSEAMDFISGPKDAVPRRFAIAYLMGVILTAHKKEFGQISYDQLIRSYKLMFNLGAEAVENAAHHKQGK